MNIDLFLELPNGDLFEMGKDNHGWRDFVESFHLQSPPHKALPSEASIAATLTSQTEEFGMFPPGSTDFIKLGEDIAAKIKVWAGNQPVRAFIDNPDDENTDKPDYGKITGTMYLKSIENRRGMKRRGQP